MKVGQCCFLFIFHYCHSIHYHLCIFSHFKFQMCEVSTKTTGEELENIEAEKTKDELIEKNVKDD